jgi:hypothetical protein
VEVGRGKRIDTLEEEKWEREVLEEVEQRTGILRSDAGMEMEGRRWPGGGGGQAREWDFV